jgi:hypothetical protein
MSCACKVTKYINKVEEKYGSNIRHSKKTNIRQYVKSVAKKMFFFVMLFPFVPLFIIYILIKNIFGNKIYNIDKIFKL